VISECEHAVGKWHKAIKQCAGGIVSANFSVKQLKKNKKKQVINLGTECPEEV